MTLENRTLYFGDNLDILREKFPDECVDLIYLDPPFNSNRNYNVYVDNNYEDDVSARIKSFNDTWKWTEETQKYYNELIEINRYKNEIYDIIKNIENIIGKKTKDGMFSYIVTMTIRLLELHRVLKPTGSIYLHCDSTASHYLKIIMDVIFGVQNFRNKIIWHYTKINNSKNNWISNNDEILFYTKTDEYIFNLQYDNIESALYTRFKDYIDINNKLTWGKIKNLKQRLLDSYINKKIKDLGRQLQDDDIIIDYTNKIIRKCDNVWYIPIVKGNSNESMGFNTQKPEELLKRIILSSTNEGQFVLDPYSGSGTTAYVAEGLHRQWNVIDIATISTDKTKNRLINQYEKISKDIKIGGLPRDLNGAMKLAQECGIEGRFDFQYWIVINILHGSPADGKSINNKKGSDRGIDGFIYYNDISDDFKLERKKIVISVKSGKNVSVKEVRELGDVIRSVNASGGIFVTLYEPTRPMIDWVKECGKYKYQNTLIDKIQICTVKDLMDNKLPNIPQSKIEEEPKKRVEKIMYVSQKDKPKSLFDF